MSDDILRRIVCTYTTPDFEEHQTELQGFSFDKPWNTGVFMTLIDKLEVEDDAYIIKLTLTERHFRTSEEKVIGTNPYLERVFLFKVTLCELIVWENRVVVCTARGSKVANTPEEIEALNVEIFPKKMMDRFNLPNKEVLQTKMNEYRKIILDAIKNGEDSSNPADDATKND